jgi:hypothetical protein
MPTVGFESVVRRLDCRALLDSHHHRNIHNVVMHYCWMVSSGMLRRVALVRTDVSEELSASFIRVIRISELGTTLAVTNNRRTLRGNTTASVVPSSPILVTLKKEALSSSETSFLTRATRCNIPETPFFIVTAVQTSNLTSSIVVWPRSLSQFHYCINIP